jgi:serine/threonine-protein kinase
MALEPGYLVSKHVRLVRELKRGGMGSVWVADHLALQTQVAVKFMAAMIADDEAAIARFAREATSAARIKSPHVVQVHDYGLTPDGVPFMVMELLHGEDLSTRLKRERPIPFDAVAQIVFQVCRVLGKAHPLGIVHRDIKPSNLFLLDADGEIFVKVLDFGVAKMGDDRENELTTTGVMVGTLVYMSPEQLLSAKTVDHRADLWSLAVAAYQAMTGQLPFKRDDGLGALCRAVETGSFTPPSACVADIPPAVDAWFERAFEPSVEARFGSAKEMLGALQRAMGRSSLPPSVPSPLLLPHSPKPAANSMPTLAAAAATIIDPAAPEHPASEAEPGATMASRQRDEPKSQTAAPAHTLAGTASLHAPSRRRPGLPIARALGIVAVFSALAAAAVVGRSRGLLPLGRWRPWERMTPASALPTPRPEAAPELGSPPVAAAPAVIPAPLLPTPGAKLPPATSSSSGSAGTVVLPVASSAAPSPAGGAKAHSQRGGARSGQPEKDYGF